MADRYARVLKLVTEHPWAILPATLDMIVEILQLRAEGVMFTDAEIQQRLGAAGPQQRLARMDGAVAVLPLFGVIAPRMNVMTQLSGGTSAEVFGNAVRAAADNPAISAIVIDADTPGGSVFGIEEAAAAIRSARGRKPIVTVVSYALASAGYWLGSQADEIIASPSSLLGAIGVIAAHTDLSGATEKAGIKTEFVTAGRFKLESAPGVPLTAEARAAMQRNVDAFYAVMVRDIARGRGVKPDAVREGFAEGRVVTAREAVKLGMADGIGTLDAVVARLAAGERSAAPSALANRADDDQGNQDRPETAAAAAENEDFRRQLAALEA